MKFLMNKFSLSYFSPLVMFHLQVSQVPWLPHSNKVALHPHHQVLEALHTKEPHPQVMEEPHPQEVRISIDRLVPRNP